MGRRNLIQGRPLGTAAQGVKGTLQGKLMEVKSQELLLKSGGGLSSRVRLNGKAKPIQESGFFVGRKMRELLPSEEKVFCRLECITY